MEQLGDWRLAISIQLRDRRSYFNSQQKKLNLSRKFFTKPCNLPNWKTCPFISSYHFIRLNNNCLIPLQSNSNCLSTNIVYIINCKKCNYFYIGESSKTAKRKNFTTTLK